MTPSSAVAAGLLRLRRLPLPARYLLALAIALLCSGFHVLTGDRFPDVAAYLLAFLGVLLCAALFDHGSGFLATAVSAVVLTASRGSVSASFASFSGGDLLVLTLFVAVSAVATVIVEALHRAVARAEAAKEALGAAAVKRRLLLDEYRHRTRNDLASLAAMLLLRARSVTPGRAAEGLREAAEHARTLARVHTLLAEEGGWPDDDPGVVDTRVFVEGLSREIERAACGEGLRPVTISVRAEGHPMATERGVYLGLVLNELVMNALKYAYPEERAGRIEVRFQRDRDDFLLRVEDDGIGWDEDGRLRIDGGAEGSSQGGLGTRLLRGLASQLRGTFARAQRDPSGTVGELRFPAEVK